MTITELKETAFAKWLRQQSRQEAELHLWECLTTGPADNMAWDLLEAVKGKKAIPAKELRTTLGEMIEALN